MRNCTDALDVELYDLLAPPTIYLDQPLRHTLEKHPRCPSSRLRLSCKVFLDRVQRQRVVGRGCQEHRDEIRILDLLSIRLGRYTASSALDDALDAIGESGDAS